MKEKSAWDDARDVLSTSGVAYQVSADWRWFVAGPFRNSSKAKGFANRCKDLGLAAKNCRFNDRFVKFF